MTESKFTDEHIGYIVLGLVLAAVGGFFAWQGGVFSSWLGEAQSGRDSRIKPIVFDITQFDMDKVVLGRRLYHDGILSGDGSISCASCHAVEQGGAEARRVSIGVEGAPGPINAPTVLNSGFNFVQFWDGRAKDLHEQAGGPMTNPIEMHSNFTIIVERLAQEPWYKERFASVFPDRGITEETVTEAVAHYEDSLQTPAPFDAWLLGDDSAVDEQVLRGHKTFQEVGCTTCHNGINVGGNSYQKMGLANNYFEERGGELTEADMGRYNVTKEDSDKHMFKVPTLRNITLTAPYFHDGSTWDLREAVRTMGHVQLNQDLTDDQITDIVAFLKSLEGTLPEHAILPEAQEPPARLFELKPDYDVALEYFGSGTDLPVKVRGRVRSVDPYQTALTASRLQNKAGTFAELTVDENAPDLSADESAGACFEFAADLLKMLERGRAEFRFVDDRTEMRVSGEGSADGVAAAKAAYQKLPDNCVSAAELLVYESSLAVQCDRRLASIQESTKLAFAGGSADLTEAAQGQLRDVAAALEGCPEAIRLRVDGHTDNSGDQSDNLTLSRLRAFAVRDALVRLGLDPARVIARGFGATRPVQSNASEEGRAANRRIELRLDRPGVSFWSALDGEDSAASDDSTAAQAGATSPPSNAPAQPAPAEVRAASAVRNQPAASPTKPTAPADPAASPTKPAAPKPPATRLDAGGRPKTRLDAGVKGPRPRVDAATRKPAVPAQPKLPPPRESPTTTPAP